MKIAAIYGGGDWGDASVAHLSIPDGMDLEDEQKKYREWYQKTYLPYIPGAERKEFLTFPEWYQKTYLPYIPGAERKEFLTFPEWLKKNGARETTDDEVLEFWES